MAIFATRILLLLALYGGFLISLASSTNTHVVDVGYARYLGNYSAPNAVAYLGLPYAEPPLAQRRFRAPLPLNTTRISDTAKYNIINATEYPDFCVQGTTGGGDAGGAGTEDCLKLNVYVPTSAKKGDKLPVLFYIHGGAYVYGNPANWPFYHWINQSPNVVIVSIYYRLDSLGFLATPEFANTSIGDFNVGFLDQIEALRWVKKHIDAFGGDPSKVTINGQSAGGSSVELHLTSPPKDEHLFSGAIAQSVYRATVSTPAQQQPLFQYFSSEAGCGEGTVSEQVACLRNASVSALARAQDAAAYNFTDAYNSFRPVVDGHVIVEPPTTAILKGIFRHVPLIVGATSNETLSGGDDISASLRAFFPQLDDDDFAEYLDVYPLADFDSQSQRATDATGESELRCAREIMGAASAEVAEAWTYRYNQPNPTSGSAAVAHAAENWMMFLGTNTGFNGTTTFTPMTPTETAFAEELIAYWLSFVRAGNPNTYKLARSPQWPQYAASKERTVLQEGTASQSGSVVEAEPEAESERCEFVKSKASKQQN